MLANSGGNNIDGSDIGSSSLPATRPLCIPVRFQPLGGATASRWMGTGALAAAASTLPPPLPACDERNSAGGDPFDVGAQFTPPGASNVWACAPADAARSAEPSTTVAAPCDGSAQIAGSSRLTDKPWLWPFVVVLVLALAILGGGAAWATWQRHRRQRQIAAATVPSQPDAIVLPLSPVLGVPAGSAAPAPPLTPLAQATDPYSAATPVPYGAHPMPSMTASEPHQVSRAQAQQQQQQPPMSPLVQAPRQQPPHAPQQQQQPQQPPHAIAQAAQPQARGTYMMVERPPLRMRNVAAASRRHGDSDDDDDQGRDTAESERRAPARSVASGPRVGSGGGDAWSQRPFSRRAATSPQESHLDAARPAVARQPLHRPGGDQAFPMADGVVGRPHEAHGRPYSGSRISVGNNRGGDASGGVDDDDDSLGDGVADYWADADRARQIYFASPEERAAQVVRLGPQAYSPDGTPMPARLC